MSKSDLTREVIESILDKKFKPLSAKIDSVIESINFMEGKFGDLNKRIDDIEYTVGHQVQENKLLKIDILNLSNQLHEQKDSVNELEQYIRRECLEISGIPQLPHEDTNEIVINVGKLIGMNVGKADISVSHRLPKKTSYSNAVSHGRASQEPKIIAKFIRRDIRDQFYAGRKRLKNKTTSDLGLSGSPKHIYINESLSPNNKKLFQECLKLKREEHFQFIWTHYGRIYLRKDSNSATRAVCNQKDLDKIRRSSASSHGSRSSS